MVRVMGAAVPYTRRHAARSRSIQVGVQGNMDSASVRGMTKFGFCAYSRNDGEWSGEW